MILTKEEREKYGIKVNLDSCPKPIPIVKFPILKSDSIEEKFLTKNLWNKIKYYKTSRSLNVNSIFKKDKLQPVDDEVIDLI